MAHNVFLLGGTAAQTPMTFLNTYELNENTEKLFEKPH